MCLRQTGEQWTTYLTQHAPYVVILFLLISVFQAQFMFFIAREFLLVMYDEYSSKAITKKLKMLKDRRSAQIFLNIEQVNEDTF